MVHEPWWELHSNMGRHEECILEEIPRLCQDDDDIFGITQGANEILEDYVKRFRYNLQKSKHKNLVKDTLKTLLLK